MNTAALRAAPSTLFGAIIALCSACNESNSDSESSMPSPQSMPTASPSSPAGKGSEEQPDANAVPAATGQAFLDPAVIDDGGLAASEVNYCQAKPRGPSCRYTYLDPPSIEFTDIALGSDHGCGIQLDGTVICWGDADEPLEDGEECRFNECGQGVPPTGTFTRIAATDSTTCALDPSGAMICWGSRTTGLEGTFIDLDGGTEALCGLHTDGTIACTGGVPSPPATGPYTQIAVGEGVVCGLKQGGVDCSGVDNKVGEFARITAGEGFACALLVDGTPYCWGDGLRIKPPTGPLEAIVAAAKFACGVHVDAGIECWGEGQEGGIDDSTCPQGRAQLTGTLEGAPVNLDWEVSDSWGRIPATGFAWNIGTNDGVSAGRLLLAGSEDLGTEDIPRFALLDGQSVELTFGLIWMPGDLGSQFFCTGPGSTATRIGDEAKVEFGAVSLLGACPGTPVEGELQFCQGRSFQGCTGTDLEDGRLGGNVEGIAVPTDTRYTLLSGTGSNADLNTTIGLLSWEGNEEAGTIDRGVIVTGPDTVFGGAVYCFGESEFATMGTGFDEESLYTFRNLSKVGSCAGASGSDSLTGCIR